MFMKRFRVSNQNGAPSDTARAVRIQPKRCPQRMLQKALHQSEPDLLLSVSKSFFQPVSCPMSFCSSAESASSADVGAVTAGLLSLASSGSGYSTEGGG